MTLAEITRAGIDPALALLPAKMDTTAARIMLLAIGLQESRFLHRRQLVGDPPRPFGPAKSFWQAEKDGGMVHGIRAHAATRAHADALCQVRGVPANDAAVWNAIEHDDVLAAALARLLLWSDPYRLPVAGDLEGAWALYVRTWRPGKPHPQSWSACYAEALTAVGGRHAGMA